MWQLWCRWVWHLCSFSVVCVEHACMVCAYSVCAASLWHYCMQYACACMNVCMWKVFSLHMASEWQVCCACAACIDRFVTCVWHVWSVQGEMSQACGVCMTWEVEYVRHAGALHRLACGAHAACLWHAHNLIIKCLQLACSVHMEYVWCACILHEHRLKHIAWTWTCSMDAVMQNGHRYTA